MLGHGLCFPPFHVFFLHSYAQVEFLVSFGSSTWRPPDTTWCSFPSWRFTKQEIKKEAPLPVFHKVIPNPWFLPIPGTGTPPFMLFSIPLQLGTRNFLERSDTVAPFLNSQSMKVARLNKRWKKNSPNTVLFSQEHTPPTYTLRANRFLSVPSALCLELVCTHFPFDLYYNYMPVSPSTRQWAT